MPESVIVVITTAVAVDVAVAVAAADAATVAVAVTAAVDAAVAMVAAAFDASSLRPLLWLSLHPSLPPTQSLLTPNLPGSWKLTHIAHNIFWPFQTILCRPSRLLLQHPTTTPQQV